MIIFLDSGILQTITNPINIEEVKNCIDWFYQLLARGANVVSSNICYYEVKRELLRRNKKENLDRLEKLRDFIEFLKITKEVLDIASELWAEVRDKGQKTADDENIDADMIICAHWQMLSKANPGRQVIIATNNIKHISIFATADDWKNIKF